MSDDSSDDAMRDLQALGQEFDASRPLTFADLPVEERVRVTRDIGERFAAAERRRTVAWMRLFRGVSEQRIAAGEYARGSKAHGEDRGAGAILSAAADAIERLDHLPSQPVGEA